MNEDVYSQELQEILTRALDEIGKDLDEIGSIDPKEFSPEDAHLFYGLGYQFYQIGDYDKAESLFRRLVIERPLEAKHWFAFAATLQEKTSFSEAVIAWTMSILLGQKTAMNYFHLAECFVSANELEKALESLNSAKLLLSEDDDELSSKIEALETAISERGLLV